MIFPWRRLILIAVIPLAFAILLNVGALGSSFVPMHDSLQCFSIFAIFAKHLRQFGEIPLWMPYSALGYPSDWHQLLCLSPVSWIFIIFSLLFRSADLLILFKLSLISELALFGASCAWFSRLLFRRFSVQVFFVIAAMMTCALWRQPYFNLRLLTPVPWIIGLMLLGFRRKSRALLFASALAIFCTSYGGAFYFIPYFVILWIAVFSINLVIHWSSDLSWLIAWPGRGQLVREALLAVLILIFAGAIGGQLLLAQNGEVAASPGRDPATGIILPAVYLGYAGVMDPATLIGSVAAALPDIAHNNEGYIYGGVPLVFAAVMGIFLKRSRTSRLIWYVLLFTTAFSVAGPLTLLLYEVPLMNNFRHVAYTSIVARFFLCASAGFGMELLLDSIFRRKLISSQFIARTPFYIALAFFVFMPIPLIWSANAAGAGKIEISHEQIFVIFSLVLGLICGLTIWAFAWLPDRKRATVWVSGVMIVTLVVLSGMLRLKIDEREGCTLSEQLADSARNAINAPLRFIPVRGAKDPKLLEFQDAVQDRGGPGRVVYDTMGSVLNYDAPDPYVERSDTVPARTSRLIDLDKSTAGSYTRLAMYGQPKAYLADHPVEVPSSDVNLGPEGVYVEDNQASLILQRNKGLEIHVSEFSYNHVTFELPPQISTAARPFLIYEDALHGEWTATAGKVALPVWPANVAFKGVEIPPQVSQITLRFGSVQRYGLAWLNALLAIAVLPVEITALVLLNRDR